jgi:hypothetical protein
LESKILYRALKLAEEVYDESMYGVDDLYRIKDIVHSVDKNHWESKKWLADKLFELYGHDAGKFYIAGGWYGMMAYQLRQKWPGEQMNIVSADCDPMCEEYAWELFGEYDIDFRTLDVNEEQDLSQYSAIINTSCEHMEQEDLLSIIERKDRQAWVAFQTNNYVDLNSHINCWPTAQLFAKSLKLNWVASVETLQLKDFNRFMVIGK